MTTAGAGQAPAMGRWRPLNLALLVPFAIVAAFASAAIRDNSFLWHIRAGSVQHDAGAVLSADPFSFTAQGDAWRTQSWIPELVYAFLERSFGGLAWANWMVFVVASLALALMGLAIYRELPSTIMVGFVMVLTAWLMGPFIQPRPVVMSYVLFAALVVVLQHRERVLWAVVPLIWLWAAVHGSWTLGGLLIILEWLRTGDRRLFRVGLVAAAASLLTAHGIGSWLVALDFLGARDNLSLMQEWQAPNFVGLFQAPFLLVVFGLLLAAVRGKVTVRDFVVLVPFTILAVSSRRSVFPASIVLIPWAASGLRVPRLPGRYAPRMAVAILGVLVAGVVVLPMFTRAVGELDPEVFPLDGAVEAVRGERFFHTDAVGGYLIYAAWPDHEVFIDDRAELYSHDFFLEFQDIIAGEFEESFERWGITSALVGVDTTIHRSLDSAGWVTLHEDENFVVLSGG